VVVYVRWWVGSWVRKIMPVPLPFLQLGLDQARLFCLTCQFSCSFHHPHLIEDPAFSHAIAKAVFDYSHLAGAILVNTR
jgi:hypothetical protein